MAERLLGDILGQSSNATSGGLLGGPSIFQTQPSRGQRRSALLSQAISSQGSNPYARLGAAFGGLIGMGGRAAGEGLGILQEPEQVRQSRLIREAQQAAAESGVDPVSEPERFLEVIDPIVESDPLLKSGIRSQIIRLQRELAPEQPELPESVRALQFRAKQAGYEEGTAEYREFFKTGGKERSTTQREKERDYYISQGYSERLATDLANNNIETSTDFAGRTRLVNITGGPVPDMLPQGYDAAPATEDSTVPTNEQGEPTGGGQMSRRRQEGSQEQPREPEGLIERPLRVGLVPYLQEGLSRSVGQFFPENFTFAETTEDRTQLRSARQQLISALSISGRPPVIEQERIERNLPSLGLLESPERARAQLEQLTSDLLRQRQADLEDLEDPGINQTLKRDIQKRINGVDAMLRLVDPRALQTGLATEQPDFTFDQASNVLSGAIDNGDLTKEAALGAFDYDSQAWPIIIDGQQATNTEGTPLYIFDEDS